MEPEVRHCVIALVLKIVLLKIAFLVAVVTLHRSPNVYSLGQLAIAVTLDSMFVCILPFLRLKNQKSESSRFSETLSFRPLSAHHMDTSVSRLASSALLHRRRPWSTRIRQFRSSAAASGDCTPEGPYSKMCRITMTQVLSSLAQMGLHNSPTFKMLSIRCQNSTRRGEVVIIPATKPYSTLQGEGRNATIISWHDTAASVGTLMRASDIMHKSDDFIATDISFRVRVKVNDL